MSSNTTVDTLLKRRAHEPKLSARLSETCKTKIWSTSLEISLTRNDTTGKRICRTAIIGTVEQYPTEELALLTANGLRMQINTDRNRYPVHPISIGDLIDHYVHLSGSRLAFSCDSNGLSLFLKEMDRSTLGRSNPSLRSNHSR